jgi:hypothetical protein
LKKCFKSDKENKMNDVWILIYGTIYIYIYIKGKDTKIYPISSLLMLVKKCKSDTTQEFHKDSKGSV